MRKLERKNEKERKWKLWEEDGQRVEKL